MDSLRDSFLLISLNGLSTLINLTIFNFLKVLLFEVFRSNADNTITMKSNMFPVDFRYECYPLIKKPLETIFISASIRNIVVKN